MKNNAYNQIWKQLKDWLKNRNLLLMQETVLKKMRELEYRALEKQRNEET